MKHKFENGKWSPPNGTFVKVPNERIPEVIQMLRDNGYQIDEDSQNMFSPEDNVVLCGKEGFYSHCTSHVNSSKWKELPFPDFKAMVTGNLPESWCIQCTEESMKYEAFERMFRSLHTAKPKIGYLVGWALEEGFCTFGPQQPDPSCGEVLQIETWAALQEMNSLSELDKVLNDPEIRNHPDNSNRIVLPKPFPQKEIVLNVDQAIISDLEIVDLINELESRGYRVTKESDELREFAKAATIGLLASNTGEYLMSPEILANKSRHYAEALQNELNELNELNK